MIFLNSEHPNVKIGKMDIVCPYCNAIKFKKESPGMCCSNGKVILDSMASPPESLQSLMKNDSPISKHFLNYIRQYNSLFQMTSFGATKIINPGGFMPTFSVQGQIYHLIGSLLPTQENDPKFLQIYFMGNKEKEIDLRCTLNENLRREIISKLQEFFHSNNYLVQSFKTALEKKAHSNDFKVIIKADKTPKNEHKRRFNAPTTDYLAIVMTGTVFEKRDIIIEHRDSKLKQVSETQRLYDALQYPIILWNGEDSYHFNLKQTNPITRNFTTKKVD